MKKELSRTQILYLKAIQKLQIEKDIEKVTYQEIGDEMGVGRNTVYDMVKKLRKNGYLERTRTGIYIIKNVNLDKV